MQSSDQPEKISIPFADTGAKRTIPNVSQIGIVDGAASFPDGFPPKTFQPITAGGVPPAGVDFNGIFNQITVIQQWQSAGMLFEFDATFATVIGGYPKGSILKKSSGLGAWVNLAENNTSDPEGGSPTNWSDFNFYFTQAGTGAVVRPNQDKLRERVSLSDYVTPGQTDFATSLKLAQDAVGPNGEIIVSGQNFPITSSPSFNNLTIGVLRFENGGMLSPTPGSMFVFNCDINANDVQIFSLGKTVTACDCNVGSVTLRGWTYGFEASDVGKSITLLYGGAVTGSAPVGNYVQQRVSFKTTVAGYTDDNTLTLTTSPVSAIRQDYVFDGGYAPVNTGVVVIGNGLIEFNSEKCSSLRAAWFGASSSNTDNATALNSMYFAYSRRYGGGEYIHKSGFYSVGRELRLDVGGIKLTGNPKRTFIFRKNGIALERMNNYTCVWRGRYGGGAPTKSAENWTFGSPTPLWGGDWNLMSGIEFDGMGIDGNAANQPALTPGTGLDGWDAGISVLYTSDVIIRSNCTFANCLRWGVALSTLSHRGRCEDGAYFENCAEGGFYAETSTDIVCGSIIAKNTPATGWNMGAVTYLRITRGVITNPISNGGNVGIYIRDACQDITVNAGSLINSAGNNGYGVWLKDESLGSNRLKRITINGGSVDGSIIGVRAEYVDDLTITGVKGACANTGILIQQCTEFNVSHCGTKGPNGDIVVDSGTSKGVVSNNNANCKLDGTSSTNISFDVMAGYSFANSASGYGYIAVIERTNFGDGNARHKISYGGLSTSSSGFAAYPLDLNGKVLWVDGSNRLRIKNGYPTSDTDGVVVGTQT